MRSSTPPNNTLHRTALPPRLRRSGSAAGERERSAGSGDNWMPKDVLWLEISKLAVGAATPILVAIFGILLLHRIEGVKALVAKQSDRSGSAAFEYHVP